MVCQDQDLTITLTPCQLLLPIKGVTTMSALKFLNSVIPLQEQGTLKSPICTPRGNCSIDQRLQSQGLHHTFNPLGNPGQSSPLFTPQRSSPSAWDSFFGTPNNYLPPNSSTGGNFSSCSIHQGGRPGFHYG